MIEKLKNATRAWWGIMRGGTVICNAGLHNSVGGSITITAPHIFIANCTFTDTPELKYCTSDDMKYLYSVGEREVKTFVMAKMLGQTE